jgi:hypothetical protein
MLEICRECPLCRPAAEPTLIATGGVPSAAPATIRAANSTPMPTTSAPRPMAAAQIAHTAASSHVRRRRSLSTPMGMPPMPPHTAIPNGIRPRIWSDAPS